MTPIASRTHAPACTHAHTHTRAYTHTHTLHARSISSILQNGPIVLERRIPKKSGTLGRTKKKD